MQQNYIAWIKATAESNQALLNRLGFMMTCQHYFIPKGRYPDGRYNIWCKKCKTHFWTNHKQVTIKPGLCVDEKMTPLLKALWKAKIQTLYSCQEPAYIKFKSIADLDYFCQLLFAHSDARPALEWGHYSNARVGRPIVSMMNEAVYFSPKDLPKFTKLFKRLAK